MNPVELARAEIRALKPYASARALANSAGTLLNANENPWPPANDGGLNLNRYPDPQPAALKARLAELYGIDAAQLLITRGSDEGIDLLTRVFCRAGADRVLICPPCFGMYALSAQVQNAELVEVPLIPADGDWQLDLAAVEAAPACRLYFLCSPNNPTGNLIEAQSVLGLAQKVAGHGLVVIDEAYIEYCEQPSLAAAVGRQPNLVVLRTLSKAYALAGCRIGAVIASNEVIELLRRIIAPYPLPTPSVAAALAALAPRALLKQRAQLARLVRLKLALVALLSKHPSIIKLWPGRANFVLLRVPSAANLVSAAAEHGIRLRDQSAQPGLDGCVRISIGSPAEMQSLTEFLQRWRA